MIFCVDNFEILKKEFRDSQVMLPVHNRSNIEALKFNGIENRILLKL